jgi:hypothetical protein
MQENSLKWPLEKCFKKYIIGTVLEMKFEFTGPNQIL